ncbi:MAG: AAA family ATPase [Solirubrobacterales bacterium]|nr:AAA family ATPase [Solirubrobacterales bacterium]
MPEGRESGRAPPLLERDGELERFGRALAGAATGEGEMLAIVGPAGIGKSSLLARARRLAQERGMRVLTASGSELERALPFGVCRQLFEPVLAGAEEAERQALLAGAAALAGRLLLAPPATDGAIGRTAEGSRQAESSGSGQAEPGLLDAAFAPLHGLYWLAANIAQPAPLLITVDDAHWADLPSLQMLNYLARRLDGLAITVAVAARRTQPGGERDLLPRLLDASEVSVLRLASLSERASAALIRESLGSEPAEEFAAACWRTTQGNPFYLDQLLRALQSAAVAPTARAARRVIEVGPPAISREVLGRVAHLEPGCAALVRALAVLGGRPDLRDAAILAELDQGEAAAAADSLAAAGVLAGELPLAFSHPIMRAAVYEDIPPLERASAHRRAAALLADRGAGAAAVAAQLLHTEPGRDAWTVARLREAAELAIAEGAPPTAIDYLRRALAESPPPEERLELVLKLGPALAAHGDPEGIKLMRGAADGGPGACERARLAAELGTALIHVGRDAEAVDVLETALAGLDHESEGPQQPLVAQLEALLYVAGITTLGARRRLGERLGRAVEGARQAPGEVAEPLLAPLACELAFAAGPASEVCGLAERARDEAEPLRGAARDSPVPFVAAFALIAGGEPKRAEQVLTVAADSSRRCGAVRAFALASSARSLARLHQGNLPGAEADAEASLRLTADDRPPVFEPIALATLVIARLERGDVAQARAAFESAPAREFDPGCVLTQPLFESGARVALAEGDGERAIAEVDRCRGWAEAWGERSGSWPVQWRPAMALGQLRAGDRPRALELAREDLERARRFGAPRPLGVALLTLGMCEGGDSGIARLGEAVATLEPCSARLEHARALVEQGAALRRDGRRAAARDPLAVGMKAARSCGATALAEHAYVELRAAGARPRKILYSGLEALTPSELRVARMAAEKMTNREIAQALFVTQKTVEVHLSHAYQKLEIGSRSELPAALDPDSAERAPAPERSPQGAV